MYEDVGINWEDFRREDSTIDLVDALRVCVKRLSVNLIFEDHDVETAAHRLRFSESLQRVSSRQLAAFMISSVIYDIPTRSRS